MTSYSCQNEAGVCCIADNDVVLTIRAAYEEYNFEYLYQFPDIMESFWEILSMASCSWKHIISKNQVMLLQLYQLVLSSEESQSFSCH